MQYLYPRLPPVKWKSDRFTIGLTGAIGSGKSTARAIFSELGAGCLDADEVAKGVLHSEQMKRPLVESFGNSILTPRGEIWREKLAAIIFRDPEARTRLNQLIHPLVRSHFQKWVKNAQRGAILVYDIPLLFETGAEDEFDLTIALRVSRHLRFNRVNLRNGWSEKDFMEREASQLPPEEKEERARLVIPNEGSRDQLKNAIAAVMKLIREVAPGRW